MTGHTCDAMHLSLRSTMTPTRETAALEAVTATTLVRMLLPGVWLVSLVSVYTFNGKDSFRHRHRRSTLARLILKLDAPTSKCWMPVALLLQPECEILLFKAAKVVGSYITKFITLSIFVHYVVPLRSPKNLLGLHILLYHICTRSNVRLRQRMKAAKRQWMTSYILLLTLPKLLTQRAKFITLKHEITT